MPGMMPAEKAKNFKGTMKRFIDYLRPQRWQILGVTVLAILGTGFNIGGPKILGYIFTKLGNYASAAGKYAYGEGVPVQDARGPVEGCADFPPQRRSSHYRAAWARLTCGI